MRKLTLISLTLALTAVSTFAGDGSVVYLTGSVVYLVQGVATFLTGSVVY